MAERYVPTHTCGDLNKNNDAQEITLAGWVHTRRDHGGVIFIDLRDRYGLTQIVFDPQTPGAQVAYESAHKLRSEFVIWCKGKVRLRPDGMLNKKIPTGEIEISVSECKILSEAKTPPFEIDDEAVISENLRLKYRYLDLRRHSLQNNLVTRHKTLSIVRNYLNEQRFVEVETPILYKSTPEGARDFIVPSRLNPTEFYALPQSPQTLKQLLMVSGLDRYYQIARCFRDEDLRADRQPEFSQIDIEASFVDEKVFFPLIEGMVKKIWKDILGQDIQTPFPHMTFHDALHRYGSDKPDIRFGLELQDIGDVFVQSEFRVFQMALTPNSRGKSGVIKAIVLKNQAENFSRKDFDDLTHLASQHGAKGLLWIKVGENGTLQSPALKFLKPDEITTLIKKLDLKSGDLVFSISDTNVEKACTALGAVRLNVGERLGLIPKNAAEKSAFLWVVDFPLFEYDEGLKRYFARHHPFTTPVPESVDDLVAGKNLEDMKASAYDLVLNGVELGGGSLRIYRTQVQDAMFRALGISSEDAAEKFGFFLEALSYGTPPHGGIALGVDRLIALICGASAIRDVMAFPKTQKGQCLMSGSPSSVSPDQLVELGVSLKRK